MTAFLAALAVITVLMVAAVPWLLTLWTDPRWQQLPHWDSLVFVTYLTMPQLFFYGAFFLIGQVLNARDSFGPMMWAPILNNVVGIGVLGLAVLLAIYHPPGVTQWAGLLFAIGFVTSFIFAMIAVKGLLKFIASHSYAAFAWYRIAFGIIVLVTAYTGMVDWHH